MCDRPVETADTGSRMIAFLQPHRPVSDAMGVVSPIANILLQRQPLWVTTM